MTNWQVAHKHVLLKVVCSGSSQIEVIFKTFGDWYSHIIQSHISKDQSMLEKYLEEDQSTAFRRNDAGVGSKSSRPTAMAAIHIKEGKSAAAKKATKRKASVETGPGCVQHNLYR